MRQRESSMTSVCD